MKTTIGMLAVAGLLLTASTHTQYPDGGDTRNGGTMPGDSSLVMAAIADGDDGRSGLILGDGRSNANSEGGGGHTGNG